MIDSIYYIKSLLFFNIPLFYYHIDLRSSVICCLLSGDIYFGIFIDFSFVCELISELFCDEYFVILLTISLPIKSPVPSAVFSIIVFETVIRAFVADYLA